MSPKTQSQNSKIGAPEPIAALNRIRILEYAHDWAEREPLVDVRTACPNVVVSEHVCPYLRRKVADMVNVASASLPAGIRLRVGSAMRTLAMQRHGWDNYHKRLREEHPEWPLSALRRATNKYFAPYDQKAPPGHCTGGAIDVGLLDANGESLDLTSPTQGWEAAYTWSDLLSPEAKANRMLMVEAMLGAGFSNCRDEYWHYSYGDSAWAVRVGESECPYGWTYPPVALEADFPNANAADLRIQFERDRSGRVLRAEGECAISTPLPNGASDLPAFAVGLFWSGDIAARLRVHLSNGGSVVPPFYIGEQRDKPDGWREITPTARDGDTLIFELTPEADRLYLASAIPPEPAPKAEVTPLPAEEEPGNPDSEVAKPDA